jgi:16S rRNA (guanine527-N7)-methyltransferase
MPLEAAAAIRRCGETLGLGLSDAQVAALVDYLALLQRWNSTYNLTAVRDAGEMLTQHLADCLAVVPALGRWRREHTEARRVLDVGSGGGLPGVVFAIVEPELQFVCVDTVGKKAAFIRQAALELRLSNLGAEHARVEALQAAPFNLITSRAFASLPDFTRLTAESLAPGGLWMAMKGKRPEDEIAGLPADIEVFHVEQITVPDLSAERCLVWMRPRAAPAPQSS